LDIKLENVGIRKTHILVWLSSYVPQIVKLRLSITWTLHFASQQHWLLAFMRIY